MLPGDETHTPVPRRGLGERGGRLSRGKRNVVIIICLLLDNRMLQVVKLTVPSMQHQYCLLLGDDTPQAPR